MVLLARAEPVREREAEQRRAVRKGCPSSSIFGVIQGHGCTLRGGNMGLYRVI